MRGIPKQKNKSEDLHTYAERCVQHIHHPHRTNSILLPTIDTNRVPPVWELDRRRIVYFHDRVSGTVDVGQLLRRRVFRTQIAK